MDEKEITYISFDGFVNNSGVKEATIKRRYKQIPGIIKSDTGFTVVSGTRYPCDLHRYRLKNSGEKRFVLLKMISQYKYVTHKDLKIEHKQFQDMLGGLLSAGLIQYNNLCNCYGANAYDSSPRGDELLKLSEQKAKAELVNLIASAAGTYTGAVISQIFNAA